MTEWEERSSPSFRVANIVLTLALIRTFGLVGVAVAIVVPMAVGNLGWMARYTLRQLSMSWSEYWSSALRGPIALAILGWLCAMFISRWLPPDSWRSLAANVILVVLCALPVFLKLVALPEDIRAALGRFRSIFRPASAATGAE